MTAATRDGRLLTLGLLGLLCLSVLWVLGPVHGGILALAGGYAIVAGHRFIMDEGLERQLLGSVLTSLGAVAAVSGISSTSGLEQIVASVFVLAIGGVGFGLSGSISRPARHTRAVRGSALTGVISGVGLVAVFTGYLATLVTVSVTVFGGITATPDNSVVSLLVLSLVTIVLVSFVVSIAESAGLEDLPFVSFGTLYDHVRSASEWAFYVAIVLGFILLSSGNAGIFGATLEVLGPVGTLLGTFLTLGVGHLLVGVVAGGAVLICTGWIGYPIVRGLLEPYPLQSLALAGGGLVALLVALPSAALLGFDPVIATGLVCLTLLGVAILESVGRFGVALVALTTNRLRHLQLVTGCLALFGATVVASQAGLSPIGVFLGIGTTLFIWDVGTTTRELSVFAGNDMHTREPIFVRAAATIPVGLLGVGIATGAMYGLGAVSPPSNRWEALAPVAIALVAFLALVSAIVLETADGRSWFGHAFGWIERNRLVTILGLIAASLGTALVFDGAIGVGASVGLLIGVLLFVLWLFKRVGSTSQFGDLRPPPP
ncbi:hypothetical protein OB919_09865 [Halobacteria archaeon AArc-curdl1]|uniref:Uncharacterized protein n=1 Tax=Natronosalvus hydrolyticus TaxID=2979988 RepID=A0AAP3E7J9_9EURY|nr:hypothetical protein [Halobacteria archaeon AArc-curdl1]